MNLIARNISAVISVRSWDGSCEATVVVKNTEVLYRFEFSNGEFWTREKWLTKVSNACMHKYILFQQTETLFLQMKI
jgi:hypothetical protein